MGLSASTHSTRGFVPTGPYGAPWAAPGVRGASITRLFSMVVGRAWGIFWRVDGSDFEFRLVFYLSSVCGL